ncbi:Calcium-binding EF-hand family protein [Rhynchospora pubera]|uniref:Calcium-binding EF-hand family protein n=1 Tax=Rhynchospora pubera TaxID=906938 RepID=A0AAV8GS61_9POAL|nr:Calcium-binding EF-hand family protein [Rhynchospora pubera]
MAKRKHHHLISLLFFFLLTIPVYSRLTPSAIIREPLSLHLGRLLKSDGVESACEQTYGFLPCTETVLGNLFLILVYGFLMFKAATFLSSGSELMLEILGPGIVGGLFLPILGALPDALLILASGLSGSRETAQSQVLVGMGLLAGSTVLLLTLLWGTCVVVGKCDLSENSTSIDSQDTKGFNLTKSGVSTDKQTSDAAKIMGISVLPFIIIQLPKVFKFNSAQRVFVLICLILSVLLVLAYAFYQIFQPWVQKRRLEYVRLKLLMSGILHHFESKFLTKLTREDGSPDTSAISNLFRTIDSDNDKKIARYELHAFLVGVQFEEMGLEKEGAVDQVMEDFDTSDNNLIEEEEFIAGISKWLKEARRTVSISDNNSKSFLSDFHQRTRDEHNTLIDREDGEEEVVVNKKWTTIKASLFLLVGTVMAAAFADPLVDTVHNFSQATKIPSFFISFIAMPLATNSSEAVSAIIFASRKKQKTSSLTFSEIYGGVTMNNTMCLAVFLALVYVRHLTWDFSSEVLIILIVCIVMGLFTSFRTNFPLWTCFVAYLLYPFSLVLVYVLDYKFGWS